MLRDGFHVPGYSQYEQALSSGRTCQDLVSTIMPALITQIAASQIDICLGIAVSKSIANRFSIRSFYGTEFVLSFDKYFTIR